MSIKLATMSASAPGGLDVLERGPELGRHVRQQLDRLDGLLLEHGRARLDGGIRRRLVGDQVEARGEERQAVQIVDARGIAARPGR